LVVYIIYINDARSSRYQNAFMNCNNNNKTLCSLPTRCIYVFRETLTNNSDYFTKKIYQHELFYSYLQRLILGFIQPSSGTPDYG